jgi:hypothetical protein
MTSDVMVKVKIAVDDGEALEFDVDALRKSKQTKAIRKQFERKLNHDASLTNKPACAYGDVTICRALIMKSRKTCACPRSLRPQVTLYCCRLHFEP